MAKKDLLNKISTDIKDALFSLTNREEIQIIVETLIPIYEEQGFQVVKARGGKISLLETIPPKKEGELPSSLFHVMYDPTISKETVSLFGRTVLAASMDIQSNSRAADTAATAAENKLKELLGI